jgi:hypothetical protein
MAPLVSDGWGWDPNSVESIGTAGALLLGAVTLTGALRDRRRQQARQVHAWIDKSEGIDGAVVHVRNSSTEPVYRVRMEATEGVADTIGYELLPAGAESTFSAAPDIAGDYYSAYSAPLVLDFTDAEGRRWRRTPNGGLHLLRQSRWQFWRPADPAR